MNFFVSVAAWQSIFPSAWWWRNGGFVQTRSFCRIQPVLVATMEVLQALGHKAISPWGFFLRENKRCKTRTVRMKPTNQESMPVFQTSLQWSLANVKNLDTLWVTLHTPGVFGICCHLLNEVWLIPMIHRSWSTALIARAFEAGEVMLTGPTNGPDQMSNTSTRSICATIMYRTHLVLFDMFMHTCHTSNII